MSAWNNPLAFLWEITRWYTRLRADGIGQSCHNGKPRCGRR